jgi:hypothetical protein
LQQPLSIGRGSAKIGKRIGRFEMQRQFQYLRFCGKQQRDSFVRELPDIRQPYGLERRSGRYDDGH